jgi:hypothetical protein
MVKKGLSESLKLCDGGGERAQRDEDCTSQSTEEQQQQKLNIDIRSTQSVLAIKCTVASATVEETFTQVRKRV